LSEQPPRDQLRTSWGQAQLAEVSWRTVAGVPDAAAVVPLVDDGVPCLALTYAELALARALDQAQEIVISVTTPAVARDADPIMAHVDVEVTEDPDGVALELRDLLPQLIGKHPPDRRRLDSLLQRREHWWYVPRLLVRFTDVRSIEPVEPRDGLLITGGDRLRVSTCTLDSTEPLVVATDPAGAPGPAALPPGGERERPALVFRQGADVPDLEQPWQQRWRGVLGPQGFEVDGYDGEGPPSRALTLRQRVTAEWRLERACKRGLRAAGHER
jgi:hypothetical protein